MSDASVGQVQWEGAWRAHSAVLPVGRSRAVMTDVSTVRSPKDLSYYAEPRRPWYLVAKVHVFDSKSSSCPRKRASRDNGLNVLLDPAFRGCNPIPHIRSLRPSLVVPAKAGTQRFQSVAPGSPLARGRRICAVPSISRHPPSRGRQYRQCDRGSTFGNLRNEVLAGCGKSRDFGKTVRKRVRNGNRDLIKSMSYEGAKGDEFGWKHHRPTFSAAC